jgi:hypothetical protein
MLKLWVSQFILSAITFPLSLNHPALGRPDHPAPGASEHDPAFRGSGLVTPVMLERAAPYRGDAHYGFRLAFISALAVVACAIFVLRCSAASKNIG